MEEPLSLLRCKLPGITFKMDVFLNLMELLPCFRLSWQDWRPDGVTNNNGPLKGWGGRIPALIRWHLIAAQTQGRACTDSVISPAQLMSPAVPKNKIKKKEEKNNSKACLVLCLGSGKGRLLLQKASK